MDNATTRIILLAMFAAIVQMADGSCEFNDLGRYPCESEISCSEDLGPLLGLVREWSCRRREIYDYNYGYRRVRVDDNYNLYIQAERIDATSLFDPFGGINELKEHILTLSVTNGKINSVPAAILNLQKASTVDLSSNTLETLNLEAFSKQNSLKSLNVSFNQIAELEVGERLSGSSFSPVNTIDLSHNAIETIPNNYFRQFPDLLHLNLSHNYIKSFDILTFEGITQLQTLFVSNNEITTLGGPFFARFVFLQVLCLDHNNLTSIASSNFNTMSKLEKLNISSNIITDIENNSFDNLVALKYLDLSNNKLNTITKTLFQHNEKLQSLDISLNKISKIEPGAFEGKRIEDFKVHNNPLVGALVKNTFQGIVVEELDMSGANITELGPDLFDGQFLSLNFSRNSINKIHNTTFSKLELLTDLDLSFNQLQNIDFDMSQLKNLSHFYVNNNYIKKITKDVFDSLTSLKTVDLSNNEIEDIEMNSFEDLNDLEVLVLHNNPLFSVIPSQMFSGLASTTDLDFTKTNISTIQNNAFNGMKSLQTFNSSHSTLAVIEYNAFNGTGSIEVLDLTNNQIVIFSLNITDIKFVKKIFLDYNKLQYVTHKTFSGLENLQSLCLKGNKLVRLDNGAFRGLKNLFKLDLSGNKNIIFNSSVFSDLPALAVVFLSNDTSGFNFGSITNTSISGLDLSFCDIVDINSVQVYKVETVERLKLTSNKIRSIDKVSFQKLRQLSWIDLSYNRLSSIQPGSFSDTEDLSVLDLSNNFLSSLQFGVFDGLVNLKSLDLSGNTLHSFSVNLFHTAPHVQDVYLDNNLITDLDFNEFAIADIQHLYIGGNLIPCDSLTTLKKSPNITEVVSVSAKNDIYDRENVDGITCTSKAKIDDLSKLHGNETVLTAALTNTLEEFRVTIERFLNRNESKIDLESIGLINVSVALEHFITEFSKSETTNTAFLEKLMNINNNTNRVLENIQEYIKMRNSIAIDPHTPKTEEPKLNKDDIEKTILDILAKEKESMKKDYKSMFDDWKSGNVGTNHFEAQSSAVDGTTDLKSALYFIGTCLVALLSVLVLAFIFVYFKLRNKIAFSNHLSNSRQPISNDIEM